jgi:hypothetical protein
MSDPGHRIISLPDGRRLAFAEYSDPRGQPLFFFRGFSGPRYDGAYTGQAAAGMGIRRIGRAWAIPISNRNDPLWQGEADTNVPPEMGRYQARNIPSCIAKFYPGVGHISLVTNHIREILMAYQQLEPVK